MGGNIRSFKKFFEDKEKGLAGGDERIRVGLAVSKASRQRLSTAQLIAAGCNSSKNPVLQSLWDAVNDYNTQWQHPTTMNNQQISHSVAILDFIYQVCATYMTERSIGGGHAKRIPRYEAFEKLIDEVAKEMQLYGGKMLVGPADFRLDKRNYWLERLDPKHRAGYLISEKYHTWVHSGSSDTFWVWLKANGGHDLKLQSRVAGYEAPGAAQWQHCLYFNNGLLLKPHNDLPFSTAGMETAFSGDGWAVFVCSLPMLEPGGHFGVFVFSYTHRAGWDHHSSFLGGAPVLAAGEWIVDSTGKIRVITGKSGHYVPKWENLYKFVTRFPAIPGDAIIRPNMLDHKDGTDIVKYYRVSDFRSRGLMATPLRRQVVLNAITATGANANIDERMPGGSKSLSSLLAA